MELITRRRMGLIWGWLGFGIFPIIKPDQQNQPAKYPTYRAMARDGRFDNY